MMASRNKGFVISQPHFLQAKPQKHLLVAAQMASRQIPKKSHGFGVVKPFFWFFRDSKK
jgi:hypothetical protein